MKHRFLLTLMLLGLPSLLYSQTDTTGAAQENDATPGTWMIVASAGWTFPAEPREFKDQFKINYNFGGGIAYSMSPGDVGYGEVSLLLHYYNTLFSRSGFRTANNLPTGTGVYGYPVEEAAPVAVGAVLGATTRVEEVRFVLFDPRTYEAFRAALEAAGRS